MPQEMSRYELAELEQEMKDMALGVDDDEEYTKAELEEFKKDPMYKKMMVKFKKLQKLRHGVIKQYFEKNKFKKASRNDIIKAAEESELAIAEVMREEHVHFYDAMPEIKEFMD